MDDIKVKNEIIEKIKSSSNILITVSNDPSVDALSAALGLTLALDKMDKYATAIYSGETPPAITFLEPEKTFEPNTDSLRDFIIALNKEKADHLRFKPEGDYVKIFITPYKTTIKPEDLEFSQGDFNVELVIALGVDKKEHLDAALNNHGQILHDATVVTLSVGSSTSALGGIDWADPQSSSLSEMIVSLIESMKSDKTTTLIDAPVATALLTGIVAETNRFSNEHTTSKVMTVAANLMSLGADQQLVAMKLQESHEIGGGAPATSSSTTTGKTKPSKEGFSISHDDTNDDQVAAEPEAVVPARTSNAYALDDAPVEVPSSAESQEMPEAQPAETEQPDAVTSTPVISSHAYLSNANAPSSAYALDSDRSGEDAPQDVGPSGFPGTPPIAPGSVAVNEMPSTEPSMSSAYAQDPEPEQPSVPQPEPAQSSVTETTPTTPASPVVPEPAASPAPAPVVPSATPQDLGLPMPPPLPPMPGSAPAIPLPNTPQPARLGDILSDPNAAPQGPAPLPQNEPVAPQPTQPPTNDPGQFQIPPQQ